MKKRIIPIITVIASLCLLAKFVPAVFEHGNLSGTGGSKAEMTNASSPSKFRYMRDEWLGDLRSDMAILRYLFEPEPPELNRELVASNDAEKNLPDHGVPSPRMPESARSNILTLFGGLTATQLASRNPFTNRSLVASIATLPSETISSPFLFNDEFGRHFPDSWTASQFEEKRGYVVDQWRRFDGLWLSNTIELLNTVATNSEHSPIAPAKNYKPGLADSVERPA